MHVGDWIKSGMNTYTEHSIQASWFGWKFWHVPVQFEYIDNCGEVGAGAAGGKAMCNDDASDWSR